MLDLFRGFFPSVSQYSCPLPPLPFSLSYTADTPRSKSTAWVHWESRQVIVQNEVYLTLNVWDQLLKLATPR